MPPAFWKHSTANRTSRTSNRVYPRLLVGGIVLMGIYAVLVPVLGFILGTFVFLAAFMYVGGYRAHGAIWGTSAAVTIFCGILFLRIAYVSLPRGIAPFDRVNRRLLRDSEPVVTA